MKIAIHMSDRAIMQELGKRIERARLSRNRSQADLAATTGLAKRTLERLEAGEPSNTRSLMAVLRALGALEGLELLLPAARPGPIELADTRGKGRVRASKPRKAKEAPPRPWKWGDER